VALCDLCQRNVSKGTTGKVPMGKLPLVGTPFSTVCVDIIGPLSPPSDGNRYILTPIDMCTRFPEAVALKDITTSTVPEALLEIFSRVGLPLKMHSDRGSQFTSDMMQEVYRLLSAKQSTTSPYHAMGNGIEENLNKSLKNLLKKTASEKPKDWHRYLGPLMFAVRDTPRDSTGFTPFELIYGRSVRMPMSLLRRLWTEEEDDSEVKTAYQYVLDLRERLEETCQLAQQELSKVQTRNQNYYNQHARSRHLCVGDSVLLLLPTEHNKLTLAWRGPYKVIGKIGDADYRVELEPGKVKTYHINMLKQYFHRHEQNPDSNEKERNNMGLDLQSDEGVFEQAAAITCVIEDNSTEEDTVATIKDADLLSFIMCSRKKLLMTWISIQN